MLQSLQINLKKIIVKKVKALEDYDVDDEILMTMIFHL